LAAVDANAYDLLILPGGRAPATLRKEPKAVEIAQAFFRQNKPVAAISHGPQTLITVYGSFQKWTGRSLWDRCGGEKRRSGISIFSSSRAHRKKSWSDSLNFLPSRICTARPDEDQYPALKEPRCRSARGAGRVLGYGLMLLHRLKGT
jgi:DJ-1/PfpI family